MLDGPGPAGGGTRSCGQTSATLVATTALVAGVAVLMRRRLANLRSSRPGEATVSTRLLTAATVRAVQRMARGADVERPGLVAAGAARCNAENGEQDAPAQANETVHMLLLTSLSLSSPQPTPTLLREQGSHILYMS
jgi:hypothetical protein